MTAHDDTTVSGRMLEIREAGERGDVRALSRELAQQRESIDRLVALEQRRQGALIVIGGLAGVAGAAAIAISSAAFGYARTASEDHVRLEQLREDLAAHVAAPGHVVSLSQIAAVRAELSSTSATLAEVRDALVDLRTEVRELRHERMGGER